MGTFYRSSGKRSLDLVLIVCLSAFLFLPFVLIVALYLLSGHSSVFFAHMRSGYRGKPFQLIKFKTLASSPGAHPQPLFWLAPFLRYTGLDELPQLWNVVKGEMSLVGPRPLPITYFALMSDEQKKRYEVKPGITGWAQVNGRHQISWQQKFELDAYYVQHCSVLLDLKILLRTIGLLAMPRPDISLQEKPFAGNE
jgi:lipopolysaccharide/colanic/teichoic acid biosynthesis glycosyltransferase